jgi:hypothetical protein
VDYDDIFGPPRDRKAKAPPKEEPARQPVKATDQTRTPLKATAEPTKAPDKITPPVKPGKVPLAKPKAPDTPRPAPTDRIAQEYDKPPAGGPAAPGGGPAPTDRVAKEYDKPPRDAPKVTDTPRPAPTDRIAQEYDKPPAGGPAAPGGGPAPTDRVAQEYDKPPRDVPGLRVTPPVKQIIGGPDGISPEARKLQAALDQAGVLAKPVDTANPSQALEQVRAQAGALLGLKSQYQVFYQGPGLPQNVQQGIAAVTQSQGRVETQEAALKDLGFKGGFQEFSQTLVREFSAFQGVVQAQGGFIAGAPGLTVGGAAPQLAMAPSAPAAQAPAPTPAPTQPAPAPLTPTVRAKQTAADKKGDTPQPSGPQPGKDESPKPGPPSPPPPSPPPAPSPQPPPSPQPRETEAPLKKYLKTTGLLTLAEARQMAGDINNQLENLYGKTEAGIRYVDLNPESDGFGGFDSKLHSNIDSIRKEIESLEYAIKSNQAGIKPFESELKALTEKLNSTPNTREYQPGIKIIKSGIKYYEDLIKQNETDIDRYQGRLALLLPVIAHLEDALQRVNAALLAGQSPFKNDWPITAGTGQDSQPPLEARDAAVKPTGHLSDGRPYYGTGAKDDPYRDYPDLNNPPFKVVGTGAKDDPYRAAPPETTTTDVAKAPQDPGKQTGKGSETKPDEAAQSKPPQDPGKQTGPDTTPKESPTYSKPEWAMPKGAELDGRTYPEGAKVIRDDGVEYTAKGGQWEAGRKLEIGEAFTDSQGDKRVWDGAGGKLAEDWDRQVAINKQYEAYREIDRLRNATDHTLLQQVIDDYKDRTKLLDNLQNMQKNLRESNDPGFSTGDAAELEKRLDGLINQLLTEGKVDPKKLGLASDYYFGLKFGTILGSDRGPTDDLSDAGRLYGYGYGKVFFPGAGAALEEAIRGRDDEGKFSWSALGLRVALGIATVGQSETAYISGQNFLTARDWVNRGEDERPDSWGALGLVGRMGAQSAAEIALGEALGYGMQKGAPVVRDLAHELFPNASKAIGNIFSQLVRAGQTDVKDVPGIISDTLRRSLTGAEGGASAATRRAGQEALEQLVQRASGAAKDTPKYGQYMANAQATADDIIKTVRTGGDLSQQQMLKLMSDPAAKRILDNYVKTHNIIGMDGMKISRAVNDAIGDIAKSTDAFTINTLGLVDGSKVGIGYIRTPKPATSKPAWAPEVGINADLDVFASVKTPTGATKEISPHIWESAYQDGFARATGMLKDGKFDAAAAQKLFPNINFKGLNQEQQIKLWSTLMDVEPGWKFSEHGALDFSTQPTVIQQTRLDGKTGGTGLKNLERPSFVDAVTGKGALRDPEQLALMEHYKVMDLWDPAAKIQKIGNVKLSDAQVLQFQKEALEQLRKQGEKFDKLYQGGYGRNYQLQGLQENLQQGISVIRQTNLSPGARDGALRDLGFKGGVEEFSYKLSSNLGALQIAALKDGSSAAMEALGAAGQATGAGAAAAAGRGQAPQRKE